MRRRRRKRRRSVKEGLWKHVKAFYKYTYDIWGGADCGEQGQRLCGRVLHTEVRPA